MSDDEEELTLYNINTSGHAGQIKAENPEEAREKVWVDLHNNHEVLDIEPIEANPRDRFQVKLTHCGSNKANGTYELMTDQSALRLAHRVTEGVCKDFVGDQSPQLKFDLALLLLASLEGDSLGKDNIYEGMKELDEEIHDKGYNEVLDEMWAIEHDEEGEPE